MKLEKWKNKWKEWSNLRKWQIWKLKLIDARLYFVSIFVGLLTGLVAVPYHYLLWYFFDVRKTFFTAHYPWYWHVLLFFILWGILIFVASLVKRMPLIAGGGIPQTRAANNGRIRYEHPFKELVAKFCGGVLALSAGLSLGREGPSVQIGSYIGTLISRWGHILKGERKQLLAAGAGAGLAPGTQRMPSDSCTKPLFDDGTVERGSFPCAPRAWHRFRCVLSACQRLAFEVLYCNRPFRCGKRLPCFHAAVPGRQFREKQGPVLSARRAGRAEARHTRANIACLDVVQEAVDSPDSRHTQAVQVEGEYRSGRHQSLCRGDKRH